MLVAVSAAVRSRGTDVRLRAARVPRRRSRGAALVVTLLLVTLGLGVALTSAMTARIELRIANNTKTSLQALAAAEAGAMHAIRLLQASPGARFSAELGDGTGGRLTDIGSAVNLDDSGVFYRTAALADATYHVRLSDNVDEAADVRTVDTDRHAIVQSRGRVGTAERIIEVMVKAGSSGTGLYGRDGVHITGGSTVDSYDSSVGAYDPLDAGSAASVGSNGDVQLENATVTVHGDISVGGSLLGSGNVTGTTTTSAPALTFPAQTPCGGPYSDGTGISGGSYSGAAGGDLIATSHDTVVIQPGTYCLDSLRLEGQATLVVNAGPVNIHLTGDADFGGGGIVNNTGVPGDLNVYSSGGDLKFTGGSAVAMTVYAPDAQLSITGGSDVFGSVVAANVTLSGGARFHVDESLTGTGDFEFVSWHEVRID